MCSDKKREEAWNLALTLKALRVNQNLTQSQAAQALKVTRDTISNWENGKTFPDVEKIKAIEKLYKVKYDDIIFLPSNNA